MSVEGTKNVNEAIDVEKADGKPDPVQRLVMLYSTRDGHGSESAPFPKLQSVHDVSKFPGWSVPPSFTDIL